MNTKIKHGVHDIILTLLKGFDDKDNSRRSMTDFIKAIYFNVISCLELSCANNSLCDVAGDIQFTV